MPLPQSRVLRISLGIVLLICGAFGFLPVVGYWMIPLGLLVLSVDVPAVRRWRRKLEVKWGRWRQRRMEAKIVSATVAFNGVSSRLP
jgi:polyferredoxin